MEEDMTGRVALVTGGAQPIGIGYSTARALAEQGYQVIVTGISRDEIRATPSHPAIATGVLDVTDQASIEALIAKLSRLDILVNCAGSGSLNEFSPEGFARTVNINLIGTMNVCLAAHELLSRQGGAVVNMGSVYSNFGSALWPGYAATRGGVVQLTKSLARSWAPDNIRVNAVAPGWIRTNGTAELWKQEDMVTAITDRTPMGRLGDPDEVGDVIAFLCSSRARFVTGVLLPVDGGYAVSG